MEQFMCAHVQALSLMTGWSLLILQFTDTILIPIRYLLFSFSILQGTIATVIVPMLMACRAKLS